MQYVRAGMGHLLPQLACMAWLPLDLGSPDEEHAASSPFLLSGGGYDGPPACTKSHLGHSSGAGKILVSAVRYPLSCAVRLVFVLSAAVCYLKKAKTSLRLVVVTVHFFYF